LSLSTLDIVILVVLLVGLVRGLMTGAVRQVAGVVSVVLGFLLAVQYATPFGRAIVEVLDVSDRVGAFLAFILLFLVVQIVMFVVVRMLERVLGALRLSFLNRAVGGLAGAFKAALLVSALLLVFRFISLPGPETRAESILYEPVGSILPASWNWLAERMPAVEPLARNFGRYVDLGEWSR